jgi:uncharacterized protein YfkK (UPF0435 family)
MANKQKDINESVDNGNIYVSLCKFQSQLITVEKKRQGFNFKYADLTDVWDVIRKPLTENGFSIIQLVQSEDEKTYIITKLYHVTGECIESKTLMNFTAKKFQDVGTAIAYYRRYSLCSMIGIVSDSDVDSKKIEDDGDIYEKVKKEEPKKVPCISNKQLTIIRNLINGHEDIRFRMEKAYEGDLKNILAENYYFVISTIEKLINDKVNNNTK